MFFVLLLTTAFLASANAINISPKLDFGEAGLVSEHKHSVNPTHKTKKSNVSCTTEVNVSSDNLETDVHIHIKTSVNDGKGKTTKEGGKKSVPDVPVVVGVAGATRGAPAIRPRFPGRPYHNQDRHHRPPPPPPLSSPASVNTKIDLKIENRIIPMDGQHFRAPDDTYRRYGLHHETGPTYQSNNWYPGTYIPTKWSNKQFISSSSPENFMIGVFTYGNNMPTGSRKYSGNHYFVGIVPDQSGGDPGAQINDKLGSLN